MPEQEIFRHICCCIDLLAPMTSSSGAILHFCSAQPVAALTVRRICTPAPSLNRMPSTTFTTGRSICVAVDIVSGVASTAFTPAAGGAAAVATVLAAAVAAVCAAPSMLLRSRAVSFVLGRKAAP